MVLPGRSSHHETVKRVLNGTVHAERQGFCLSVFLWQLSKRCAPIISLKWHLRFRVWIAPRLGSRLVRETPVCASPVLRACSGSKCFCILFVLVLFSAIFPLSGRIRPGSCLGHAHLTFKTCHVGVITRTSRSLLELNEPLPNNGSPAVPRGFVTAGCWWRSCRGPRMGSSVSNGFGGNIRNDAAFTGLIPSSQLGLRGGLGKVNQTERMVLLESWRTRGPAVMKPQGIVALHLFSKH